MMQTPKSLIHLTKNKKNLQQRGVFLFDSPLSSSCQLPDEVSHELMLDISRWQIQSLLQLLDSLTDYVFFKDSRSIYFNCNRAFAKLVGLKYPHHIIGRSDYDLPWQVSRDTAGVFRRYDQQVLAGKPHTNQLQNLTLKNKSLTLHF